MARSRGIEALRNAGQVDKDELSDYKNFRSSICTTISRLLTETPTERPTASQLLVLEFTEATIERIKSLEELKIMRQTIQKQEQLILRQEKEIQTLRALLKLNAEGNDTLAVCNVAVTQ